MSNLGVLFQQQGPKRAQRPHGKNQVLSRIKEVLNQRFHAATHLLYRMCAD